MKKNTNNLVAQRTSAFTLVELIVVITILAILGTIAFISLNWYSKSSRDSVRISDVSNMKTSLELFHLNAWKYPLPDDNIIVDYNTEPLWYQWDFWNNVVSSLSRNMSEVPTDPLTDKKYIYSVSWNKNEFEILSLLEWDLAQFPLTPFIKGGITPQTNAANLIVTPKVSWTYNWVFIKTANYIIPVPSILNSEVNWVDVTLDTDISIKSQIINNGENIPNLWNVNYNTWALTWLSLIATWTITDNSTDAQKLSVYQAIYDAYTGSVLATDGWVIQIILNKTTPEEKIAITETVILDNSTAITTTTLTYSCDDTTKPTDNWHITFIVGTPTETDQAYIQDETNCGYSCTDWYTGTSCEIAPPLITSTDCTNAGWYWVDWALDNQWDWFCISPRIEANGDTDWIAWQDVWTSYW